MIASRFAPSFDTLIKIGVILIAVVLASVLSVAGAAIHPLVGFGAIIGVIAALAILVQPTLGLLAFVLTVTLLPFAVIPVPIGGVRLTFVDGILSAVLLVWLARLLTRRQERLITSAVDGPILLFLGLAIVSYILGIQSTSAEVTRFFLKTINSILFFFVASNLIHDRRTLRLVVQTIAVGALGASVIAIILYLLPADLVTRILGGLRALGYYPAGGPVVRTIAESQLVRAIGTSVDPNVLAGTLLLTVPYAITQLFSRVPIFPRKYLWPASGIMLLCLVLTYSRGAYFGAICAVLLLAVLRYRRIWLLVLLVAALLLAVPSGDIVLTRFESGLSFEDRAAQMRLGEYRDAIRLIQAYPWFGVGFGASPDIELYIAASSIYLLIAENMGLIGLASYLIVVGVFYVTVLGNLRKTTDPVLESILLGAMASLTAALSAGIFDHYFFNLYFPQTVALFWLNVALAMTTGRLSQQEHEAADEGKTQAPGWLTRR